MKSSKMSTLGSALLLSAYQAVAPTQANDVPNSNAPSLSGSLTRIIAIPSKGDTYAIRPFADLEAKWGNKWSAVARAYDASPIVPPYLGVAAINKEFDGGSKVSVGKLDYSLSGAQGTLINARSFTIPSPVPGYRFPGNIGGIGAEVNFKAGNSNTAISFTNSSFGNTLPSEMPPNIGVNNFRIEQTVKPLDGLTFKALAIESTGGKLPYDINVKGSQTFGGAAIYEKTVGPVDLRAGVEAAYNTQLKSMLNGSLGATYHARPDLDLSLVGSALTRETKTPSFGLQGLAEYKAAKGLTLMAGAGLQSPDNPQIVGGFSYSFDYKP